MCEGKADRDSFQNPYVRAGPSDRRRSRRGGEREDDPLTRSICRPGGLWLRSEADPGKTPSAADRQTRQGGPPAGGGTEGLACSSLDEGPRDECEKQSWKIHLRGLKLSPVSCDCQQFNNPKVNSSPDGKSIDVLQEHTETTHKPFSISLGIQTSYSADLGGAFTTCSEF